MSSHDWHKSYPATIPHEIDFEKYSSIPDAVRKTCQKFPDRIAITCMGADVTYRQLDRLTDRFAAYLQQCAGLKKGDRIAIMMPNIIQFPIAFLGAQKAGLICISTNPLYTPREMEHQFKDSGASALVIVDLFMDKLEKIIENTSIKTVICTSVADQLPLFKSFFVKLALKFKKVIPEHKLQNIVSFKTALSDGAQKTLEIPDLNKDDLALLQYTGGTTGLPKGAMLSHGNILANMIQIEAWVEDLFEDGRNNVLTALPLYHIFALSVNCLTFLAMGSRLLFVPKPIPIKNTVAIFKKYDVHGMTGVNTLFNALNNDSEFKRLAPKTLKISLAGGMALQDSVSQAWQQITGQAVREGFGLTEASPVTHCNILKSGDTVKGSIGLPLPSTVAKIVDADGNELPVGQEGEMIISGPQVMKGYWNRPEETAKTIRDGWLWTGDVAKRDENGYFYIVDRKKDMILVSGFNVYPNEVEAVLASHPKVLEAAVIGIKDSKSGESVKAFIVKKDDGLTEEELRGFCREQLTNYKRPRSFEFRADLPKTNVGKILRRELRP